MMDLKKNFIRGMAMYGATLAGNSPASIKVFADTIKETSDER